jgi:SAM-dependent methyltransferase
VYETALRAAAAGDDASLALVGGLDQDRWLDPAAWCGMSIRGDAGLLDRCAGATLDVGCGPGRLVGALDENVALGIDLSPAAVGLARRRGASALLRDVFGPVPGEGLWHRVLLADGNVGIGGDPVALLRRCRALLAADGQVLAEVDPPGRPTWSGPVRLRASDGAQSTPFRWAFVGVDDIARIAEAAAMRTLATFSEEGRWFASLAKR